jgi:hypothetical protein
MKWVNRMAVVVRPKEPYYAWARSLEADATIDGMRSRDLAEVYLVDQRDGENPEKVLQRCWQEIFEQQLYGWRRVDTCWPQRRTLAMFHAWFEAEVIELVNDLSNDVLDAD